MNEDKADDAGSSRRMRGSGASAGRRTSGVARALGGAPVSGRHRSSVHERGDRFDDGMKVDRDYHSSQQNTVTAADAGRMLRGGSRDGSAGLMEPGGGR